MLLVFQNLRWYSNKLTLILNSELFLIHVSLRKGATTEMKWKKMIEYIALSHFPHIKKGQLRSTMNNELFLLSTSVGNGIDFCTQGYERGNEAYF